MSAGWKVTIVHGPDKCDEEFFEDLHAAMDWADLKGAEYHPASVDCTGRMKKMWTSEALDGTGFQYGTDYHWVTFERIDE